MGYCEKHDCVYQTEECPSCTEPDGTTSTQANVEQGSQASRDNSDSKNEKQDGAATGDNVSEELTDISVDERVGGDIVIGDQQKQTVDAEQIEVDRSTTNSNDRVHDESTTVADSVLNNSSIDQNNAACEEQDSGERGSNKGTNSEEGALDKQFCPNCGTAVSPSIAACPSCGRSFE